MSSNDVIQHKIGMQYFIIFFLNVWLWTTIAVIFSCSFINFLENFCPVILSCAFINFWGISSPVRIFHAVSLFDSQEYIIKERFCTCIYMLLPKKDIFRIRIWFLQNFLFVPRSWYLLTNMLNLYISAKVGDIGSQLRRTHPISDK